MAHVHILGICGTFMAGIALIAREAGHRVTGSDANVYPPMSTLLAEQGIAVSPGEDLAQLDPAPDVVVIGNALSRGHPVVEAVLERGLRYTSGPQWLSEAILQSRWVLAVAGTHGKTTTTSMVAALLDGANIDPTVINGGIIHAYGSNYKAGESDWMVVESDESDGTFAKLHPTCAVVTNIDAEHMDHYGSMEKLREAFDTFVENLPFYGFAVLCTDHPEVQGLAARVTDRRRITYGFNRQADVRAINLKTDLSGAHFDVALRRPGSAQPRMIEGLTLPMAGEHNVQNALAAVAVALELGATDDQIRTSMGQFGGVKRRFTQVGEWVPVEGKPPVRIIDDYGHHPVEISAVLKAARAMQGQGQLIAVCQPHRYTRLRDLFEDFSRCFDQADHVLVAPVYEAGESSIDGFNHETLVASIVRNGHRGAATIPSMEALPETLKALAEPGAMVVCLGAGDITKYAAELAEKLSA